MREPEAFAADLAALFRDPAGVTELRDAFPGDDTTLSPAVFLQRAAARSTGDALEPGPGNLTARARWIGLTAMAEPWLGAVRTWHETLAELRPPAIGAAAEHELYWRLAGYWPVAPDAVAAHLGAAPIPGVDARVLAAFGEAACSDGSFRYSFDGTAARVAEIGERVALGQLVLRMALPGTPVLVSEDEAGSAAPAVLSALKALRADQPEHFNAPLRPVTTAAAADADDRVCCFMRGASLLVAVTVGDRATGAAGWSLPDDAQGLWRDALTGRSFELPDRASLAGILGPDGRAVLTRVP